MQRIVFGAADPVRRERIQENVLPVTVLSSLVLASIAVPLLPYHAGPLAIAQARRPRPIEETVPEPVEPQKLGRSHTVTGTTTKTRRARPRPKDLEQRNGKEVGSPRPGSSGANGTSAPRTLPRSPRQGPKPDGHAHPAHRQSLAVMRNNEAFMSSASLPDYRKPSIATPQTPPASAGLPRRPADSNLRRHSHAQRASTPSSMSRAHKVRMLRQNYFRTQTQFLTALEGISARLVAVPKPARLSALRAELALVAQDLPAEVDIPLICPATLEDGIPGRSKHHRIVRLNPAEATSLNSAEKVPYLLMVEVLREDFDFDPESEQNLELISRLLSEKGRTKRRIFDITDASRRSVSSPVDDPLNDSVFEPANGDLASPALLQDIDGKPRTPGQSPLIRAQTPGSGLKEPPRLSSGVSTLSSAASVITPRSSESRESGSSTPAMRRVTVSHGKVQAADQPDVSALATHMRMASQMLAQLDMSGSKRPKTEVAAIKAKIIASMQSLEEQSFYADETANAPSFDTIMAHAGEAAAHADPDDLDESNMESTDPNLSSGAGAARMENDIKTGGVQRKGDRDDPSAATFGEAWEAKKERIRRASPYGWVKNWDLLSVIVKTGADLRQEAFACQLIAVCDKIWQEAGTDVWVKRMRILVTGETSGLIETITNGVSLHSLKRSLTLATITAGTNPRKRIATLQDHFAKTFGEPDSPAYAKAVTNFAKSLAAYSTICYVLQLKDRHNGNILIDSDGHIIHIDFGFMLSNSPGSMGFEAAPFKLTQEYVDVLGGIEGQAFKVFKDTMKEAFQALRREAERIVTMVELMGRESRMPCFGSGLISVVAALRSRFVLEKSREEAAAVVDDLVAKSVGSYYTRLYDTFQYRTQGIY